eukprot:TRINITY_DN1040_c0_g1_i1.p1 TRINITY_DN1040_c0_g1~~TRINITY_DN1040_c0_g1_i1.p1  ORF type:complete len:649 (+),score=260.26 TRINITY_DN1040_c0_g1_i1:72-2018(+)
MVVMLSVKFVLAACQRVWVNAANLLHKVKLNNRRSWTHFVFNLPICALFLTILLVEMCAYVWVRVAVCVLEYVFAQRSRKARDIHARRRKARDYATYKDICKEVDAVESREAWRMIPDNHHYDWALVVQQTKRMRTARLAGDLRKLMDVVTLAKNYAGCMNLDLYTKTWHGTKVCIEEYQVELVTSLQSIADADLSQQPSLDRARNAFLHKAKAEYGNTTLCLSGGAMLGLYHIGVIKALLEAKTLPRIISGTSAGAIVAVYVGARTDAEILADVNDKGLGTLHSKFGHFGPFWGGKLHQLKNALLEGAAYDTPNFVNRLKWFAKDLTFLEAYRLTGRTINIPCTPLKTERSKKNPPVMLNYITAPHVPLAHAAMASSCVPFLLSPPVIMERIRGDDGRYLKDPETGAYLERPYYETHCDEFPQVTMRDGSFESDIPILYMGHAFNSQYNIVSQVNPHIVPFFFNNTGEAGRPLRSWHNRGGWRGGFLLSFAEMWLKEDMRKYMKLFANLRLSVDVVGVDWASLYLQEQMGDITLTPPLMARDYWRIADNLPDGDAGRELLGEYIRAGERYTWRALTYIGHRMNVQNAIDAAVERHLVSREDWVRYLAGSDAGEPQSPPPAQSQSPPPGMLFPQRGPAPAPPIFPRES